MSRPLPHPSVLERHASQGTLHELVAAWGGRPAPSNDANDANDASDPPDAPLARLACALRLELALLRARPGLLFPCLWNRLWWDGAPEAAAFSKAPPPPALASTAVLRPWLEAWRASRPASAPWLRSLRPPERGLGGALLEEWRGPFGSVAAAALTDGARRVSLRVVSLSDASPRGLRWDRVTGA
ncbi:MAG TPA: hypothetical protein VFS00_16640, partial [Polyangiaceae bacterium]|nr:hypothetical protein [Polyangiaceae bacterium]